MGNMEAGIGAVRIKVGQMEDGKWWALVVLDVSRLNRETGELAREVSIEMLGGPMETEEGMNREASKLGEQIIRDLGGKAVRRFGRDLKEAEMGMLGLEMVAEVEGQKVEVMDFGSDEG